MRALVKGFASTTLRGADAEACWQASLALPDGRGRPRDVAAAHLHARWPPVCPCTGGCHARRACAAPGGAAPPSPEESITGQSIPPHHASEGLGGGGGGGG